MSCFYCIYTDMQKSFFFLQPVHHSTIEKYVKKKDKRSQHRHGSSRKTRYDMGSTSDDENVQRYAETVWRKKNTKKASVFSFLDHELFDLVLDRKDLGLQVGCLVGGDRSRDDSAGDTAGTAESGLGGNKDVRDVLVFAQQGKVKQNFQRFGISYK